MGHLAKWGPSTLLHKAAFAITLGIARLVRAKWLTVSPGKLEWSLHNREVGPLDYRFRCSPYAGSARSVLIAQKKTRIIRSLDASCTPQVLSSIRIDVSCLQCLWHIWCWGRAIALWHVLLCLATACEFGGLTRLRVKQHQHSDVITPTSPDVSVLGVTPPCGCKWSFSELVNYKSTFCTGVEAVVSTTVVFEACLTCKLSPAPTHRLVSSCAHMNIFYGNISTYCSGDKPQGSRDSWAQSFQPCCGILEIPCICCVRKSHFWPSQDTGSFPASAAAVDAFDAGAGLSLFGTSFSA